MLQRAGKLPKPVATVSHEAAVLAWPGGNEQRKIRRGGRTTWPEPPTKSLLCAALPDAFAHGGFWEPGREDDSPGGSNCLPSMTFFPNRVPREAPFR